MQREKRFVYILRSKRAPSRHYVGITSDVGKRVAWHNAGQNVHTVRERPWSAVVSMEFATQLAAYRFEPLLEIGFGPRVRETTFLVDD
jgi:predicted GIY-YIG superfamily endonuclease